jgi:hypothetical protein
MVLLDWQPIAASICVSAVTEIVRGLFNRNGSDIIFARRTVTFVPR